MTREYTAPVLRHAFALVIITAAIVACERARPSQPPADLIIVNGRVYTANLAGAGAEAVAIHGTTITHVGTSDAISALRGEDTRVIDARGGTIAPGFNDSHVHFLEGGRSLDDVDLAGLTTLDVITEKIRAFAAANRDAPWIVGRGWLYTPFPGGTPTKAQLDAAVADRPAIMHCYDGHSVWVNSKALAVAGITKATRDPPNGIIVRDARGEPTGHLKEAAAALIDRVLPPVTDDDRLAAVRAAVAEANRHGITSIQNAGNSLEEVQIYERARSAGDLRVRAYLALSVSEATTEQDLDRMDAAWKRLGDDATLKTGAVKIYADGVIESRTAAMLAPYVGGTASGAPNLSPEALAKLVTMIDRRGWQIWIHAIGDRAIRMALDAIEHAQRTNPNPARGRRHRLEHIETIDEADIPRFGKLGVMASQQPMHVALGDMNSTTPSGPWPDNLGPARYARAWAWKSIQDAGGRSTFGSDWPVAPLDVVQGLSLAVTRTGPTDARPQRLDTRTALAGYTQGPAYASFEEQRKGTLAAGMLADIVVLSKDVIADAASLERRDITVEYTIFDGKVVFARQ
jgi:predicted amidohydrolase YtcJ